MEAADGEDGQEDRSKDVAAGKVDPAQVNSTSTGGEMDASAFSKRMKTE